MILTPNGLQILDALAVLPLIRDKCYISTYRCFKDRNDVTTKKTPTASEEKYGYSNHRLWRSLLLDTMLKMLDSRDNIRILYDSRLTSIHPPSPSQPGVSFDISNSHPPTTRTYQTDLLIGADGINSTVRTILHPTISPIYTGTTALLTHIPRSSIPWPYPHYEPNATIQDHPGALFFLPEDPACETIMVGKQTRSIPSDSISTKSSLQALQADKSALCTLFTDRYDEYGATARNILDSVAAGRESIYIWPFMRLPALSTWFRPADGRVVLLGDAAHAIPPSSGQGVNQVLEDIHMLTLLFLQSRAQQEGKGDSQRGSLRFAGGKLLRLLSFWQTARQKRIDRIAGWASGVRDVARLGEEEREAGEVLRKEKKKEEEEEEEEEKDDDMAWLYIHGIEGEVREYGMGNE